MRARRTLGALAGLAAAPVALAAAAGAGAPAGAPATCAHQSGATFPRGAQDLRIGPLALVGGRIAVGADALARVGGAKYPAVVRGRHRVVVAIAAADRAHAALTYGDRAHRTPGRAVADGDAAVAFRSCTAVRAQSTYAGQAATFWSGFVVVDGPRCVHLRVWVDSARRARPARLAIGADC